MKKQKLLSYLFLSSLIITAISCSSGDQPAEEGANPEVSEAATQTTDAAATPVEENTPKKMSSLSHIKDVPFKKGGQLLNTVYIAREGDTLQSVSEKLFGENKTKLLKKTNPYLKNRDLKTGDKVYF